MKKSFDNGAVIQFVNFGCVIDGLVPIVSSYIEEGNFIQELETYSK